MAKATSNDRQRRCQPQNDERRARLRTGEFDRVEGCFVLVGTTENAPRTLVGFVAVIAVTVASPPRT
jgi:hypothetical protein